MLSRPNVQWVGPKRQVEVPAYLRDVDVGLVPYSDTAFNRASFPLKVLDYMSAGLRVVANHLPSIRWRGTDLIDFAQSQEQVRTLVGAALTTPRDESLVA